MSRHCPACEQRRRQRKTATPTKTSTNSSSPRRITTPLLASNLNVSHISDEYSSLRSTSPSLDSDSLSFNLEDSPPRIRIMQQASKDTKVDPLSSETLPPATTVSCMSARKRLLRLRQLFLKWLNFYVRFLQTSPLHQDKLLKSMQWTAWLLSVAMGTLSRSTALSLTTHQQMNWSQSLQTLSSNLSFARYATRLLELPTALQAICTGSWTVRPQQSIFRWLGRATSWSMLGYYPTEYISYILWTTPLDPSNKTRNGRVAAKFAAYSCRFWLVYLVAEASQCALQLKTTSSPVVEDDQQQQPLSDTQRRSLRLQVLRDALFLLPCVHWSLPNWDTKPWLSTKTVNGLMWAESMVCLYQAVAALMDTEKDKTTVRDEKEE